MRHFIRDQLWKAAICFALLAGAARLEAAAIDFDSLSVPEGFNFTVGDQNPVGFITSLTIGSTNFPADFLVKDPTNTTLHVVAVLSLEKWAGATGDAIEFEGRLSTANKQRLANVIAELSQEGQTGPPVQFNFLIFDYDSIANTYYQAFEPANNAALNGFVALAGVNDDLSVMSTAATDITSPANYAFNIHIAPAASSQNLAYSTSASITVEKNWVLATVPPVATTLGASQITGSGATLQSTVNPGGAATSAYFEYGTSPTLATKSTSSTAGPGSGSSAVPENIAVSNLAAQTTYYYRIVGTNSQGRTPGNILSFNTVTPLISFTNCVVTNHSFRFNFVTVSNAVFSVLGTTNLTLAVTNWTQLGAPTEVAPGQYQFIVPATNPARFYRVSSP